MAGLGWQELLIVLVIVMIIFGAGKISEVGSSLGRGIREFKVEAGDDRAADAVGPAADRNHEGSPSQDRDRALRTDRI